VARGLHCRGHCLEIKHIVTHEFTKELCLGWRPNSGFGCSHVGILLRLINVNDLGHAAGLRKQ
jgi:hypothetical protein